MDTDVRRGLVAIDELLAEALGRLEAACEDTGKWGAVVPPVAPDAVIGRGLHEGQLAVALGVGATSTMAPALSRVHRGLSSGARAAGAGC